MLKGTEEIPSPGEQSKLHVETHGLRMALMQIGGYKAQKTIKRSIDHEILIYIKRNFGNSEVLTSENLQGVIDNAKSIH